ncbi:hypothetical protein fugu_003318 [Takifugu bimaculatus]|uniref:Uncharacterized protein n=1 Tax=Takifugu bimaculatus TaxID=433685 RepID=A0A4Z2BG94_9TELE|nr:hypothetical protein fugu_003318 [Takifugu bimaculatus]
MINIFIWSAVVYKCEHFHGDAAISPKPVGQRRRCPSPLAACARHHSVHSRLHSIVQEPRHTCRLYCISSHCTQSSVSCQSTTTAPIFPHQSPCVGQNLSSRSRRSGSH